MQQALIKPRSTKTAVKSDYLPAVSRPTLIWAESRMRSILAMANTAGVTTRVVADMVMRFSKTSKYHAEDA